MNVCFFGHRRLWGKDIRERLKNKVEKFIQLGAKFFKIGTHGDFDNLALSVCRELRNTYKDIEIEVVLTSYHKIENKLLEIHKSENGEIELLHQNYNIYDDVKTIMYDIEDEHFKKQITMSNRQMIDDCDVVICYVNMEEYRSGAKQAVKYAQKQGKEICNLFRDEDKPFYGWAQAEKDEYWKTVFKDKK